MRGPLFRDRAYAGQLLAQRLTRLAHNPSVLVLALPRGGVPVGFEIATALGAPLDVFVVRKLGVPGHVEYAMGAIAPGGVRILDSDTISGLDIAPDAVEAVTRREQLELERRTRAYRVGPAPRIQDATVILVDDGIATGASMQAAVTAIRRLGAGAVVVAAPVMSREALRLFGTLADRCECLVSPEPFGSVGAHYEDFDQLSDADVRLLLSAARHRSDVARQGERARASGVVIPAGSVELLGDLVVPHDASGIVVFAHGSGSSRRSTRNQHIAAALNQRGFATLLFDLLTETEERWDRERAVLRFDIELLASRLVQATDFLHERPDTRRMPLGYFGASTGSAAALVAAANRSAVVRAVVCRGGRPDLASGWLAGVRAPTLMIVGGNDLEVLALNRSARDALLSTDAQLLTVPGASHLFEEPGALDQVARLAGDWFATHLVEEPAAVASR